MIGDLGSFAALDLVRLAFIPFMRAQKLLRLAASAFVLGLGDGALKVPPVCRLYDARPAALRPPLGDLPALRCHAAVFIRLAALRLGLMTCPSPGRAENTDDPLE